MNVYFLRMISNKDSLKKKKRKKKQNKATEQNDEAKYSGQSTYPKVL